MSLPASLDPEPDPGPGASPLKGRRRVVIGVFVVAALAAGAGLFASTAIKSPEQVAADTRAPAPSLLTASVQRKVLSTTLVMRGKFTGGKTYPFTPASTPETANGPAATTLVVTRVRTRVGAEVQPGRVLFDVSERPVFAFQGRFPAYRDMLPGENGKDIAQLQVALAKLGFSAHDSKFHYDRRGYFGAGTKSAVRRFYTWLGYSVPLTNDSFSMGAPNSSGSSPQPTATDNSSSDSQTAPQPMVPMSEVAFLPLIPARVAALSAHVGDTLHGADPPIAFSTGGANLTARLDPANESLVKVGTKVAILAEATGFTATGSVASIGAATNGSDGVSYIPLVIVRDHGWGRELVGQDVRVTITTATSRHRVLAVPEAAISSAADGTTSVTVVGPNQVQHPVKVNVGVSADGLVEVTPLGGGVLVVGDRVVTGQ
jgi:peptidoglycan hydrolase-like protein with peptidoglycan-binding domain